MGLLIKLRMNVAGSNYYFYGVADGKYDSKIEKEKCFVIYTKPQIFDGVSLSSLEGIFIQEPGLKIDKDLSLLQPQIYFGKDRMQEFEKEYGGKFFPLKK